MKKNTEKKSTTKTRRTTAIFITAIGILLFLLLSLWSCGNRDYDGDTTTEVATSTDAEEVITTSGITTAEITTEKDTTTEGKTTEAVVDTEQTTKVTTEETTPQTTTATIVATTEKVTEMTTEDTYNHTTTEATTEERTTTQATTEARTEERTTTEATTEAGCKHNWIAEMETKERSLGYSISYCKYCWAEFTDVSTCAEHCSLCGGVWTHEELISAGWTENDTAYKIRIGRAKGSRYTTVEQFEYVEVPTGMYYCDKCWSTKYE